MPAYANAPMFTMPAYASTHARSGSTSSDDLTTSPSPSPFDPTSTWPEWMLDDLDCAKPLRGTASYQSLTAAARAVTAPAPRPVPAQRRRQQQQQCKLAKLVLPRLSRPSTSDSEYSDAPHTPVSPWDDEPHGVRSFAIAGRDGDFALASRRRDIYYPAPPVGLGFREAAPAPAPLPFSPVEVVPSSPSSSSSSPAEVPVELLSAAPRRSHRLRRTGSKIALKLLAMVVNKLVLSLLFKLMMRTAPSQCLPALYVLLRVVSAARKQRREELVVGAAAVLAGLVCACGGALVVLSTNSASGVGATGAAPVVMRC